MKSVTTNRIAQTAYVMNLIGGGMAEPRISIKKEDHTLLLKLHMAGVQPEKFSVEIHKNFLFVFVKLQIDPETIIPYLVYSMEIPHEAILDLVEAYAEDSNLLVSLPISEWSNGYHRSIEIKRL